MQVSARVGHAAYQQGQVGSASPLRVVVLLYEGAVRFARQALESFDDPAIRGQALGRTHRIVLELLTALDYDKGGEIATNLDNLYHYVLEELTRSNLEHDRAALQSVLGVLDTLLAGWRGIDEKELLEGNPRL